MKSKLDQLKEMTTVVADTGDIDAIRKWQPIDATTNPSLLLKAAALPAYESLIKTSVDRAISQSSSQEERLSSATDYLAVSIGCEILKTIPGRVSTEVDARLSFDTEATVNKARKLIALYEQNGLSKDRVLIKIASTWEGIRAAEILEKEGIQCNLTLLFAFVQAVACAQAGTYLISPFVGRILDWYKQKEGRDSYAPDEDPGVISVRNIYDFYKTHGFKTVVMGASFRNTGEIEALAGCDRLTISPDLLTELANDRGDLTRKLIGQRDQTAPIPEYITEKVFRWEMNNNPMATEKLAEGIRKFAQDQVLLEERLQEYF
ncbi:MAG: transaldolase [Pseudomonadales bacterium]|nr:transaldolase [Pseudomonadales bacterium]